VSEAGVSSEGVAAEPSDPAEATTILFDRRRMSAAWIMAVCGRPEVVFCASDTDRKEVSSMSTCQMSRCLEAIEAGERATP
jgi:hypothetical protein